MKKETIKKAVKKLKLKSTFTIMEEAKKYAESKMIKKRLF
jgi:hypothetical protein